MKCIHFVVDGKIVTSDLSTVIQPSDILSFFTGADKHPPIGFGSKASLFFTKQVCATASTCDLTLNLPYVHGTYDRSKSFMIESVVGHGGFGRV